MAPSRIIVGNSVLLAILLVSVSVSFALFSTVMMYSTDAALQDDVEDIVVVTEFLDNERYVELFSEPPYTIDIIGHWDTNSTRKLVVKVAPSDIQNFEEMKSLVKDLLSGSRKSANVSQEYERWNDLLSSTINGAKVPMLYFEENGSAHDILVELTDGPHPNGNTKAVTMLCTLMAKG